MKSIIKTNQPEVGHGIAIFDPTKRTKKQEKMIDDEITSETGVNSRQVNDQEVTDSEKVKYQEASGSEKVKVQEACGFETQVVSGDLKEQEVLGKTEDKITKLWGLKKKDT